MQSRTRKFLLLLLLVGVVSAFVYQGSLRTWLSAVIEYIHGVGPLGAVLFALLYVLATVAALPASLLTIAAGLLYGPYWAALLVLGASNVGATLAFVLGRAWLRSWVEGKYGESMVFRAIDDGTSRDGAKLVFLLRLSPVVPFSILNYLLGLTSVSLRGYVLASLVGMMPGILLYTQVGSTLGKLSEIGSGTDLGGTWGGTVFWFGVAATLLVTIVLGRWAAQALRAPVDESRGAPPA
ncbi:MAG: TVP38/TMEM64 family protein [Myxococcales bacterium]|nr:TVP38/TMEM64 family protein [Myxococcales bacterium]